MLSVVLARVKQLSIERRITSRKCHLHYSDRVQNFPRTGKIIILPLIKVIDLNMKNRGIHTDKYAVSPGSPG